MTAKAAPPHWPYDHRTVAEIWDEDERREREKANTHRFSLAERRERIALIAERMRANGNMR